MKLFRKILSILVVACILFSVLPMTVLAEVIPPTGVTAGIEHANYIYCNGIPVMIKEVLETDGVTKNTYIYDEKGENRLYETPLKDVLYVFGGAEYATVASTKIIMNSGIIGTTAASGGYLYAGGGGDVTGPAEAIVNGGYVSNVYGCGSTGTAGSVRIEYNNSTTNQQALVCGGRGVIYGDVDIVLNKPKLTTLCGGGNGTASTYVGGNVNITINGGGTISNIYGGGVNSPVKGSVNINITGNTVVSTKFDPMRKTANDKVYGGAWIDVPAGYSTSKINTKNSDGTDNTGIFIFQGGLKVHGPDATYDADKGNIYANGLSVIIKTNPADGKTYLYDSRGIGRLLATPLEGLTIFGGTAEGTLANTNVIMESGSVKAIYGGGLNGTVTGNSFVNLKGGVAESVYAGGINGTVNTIAQIKITEGATVTNSVYASNIDKATEAVVWVNNGFDRTKIKHGENVRIFVDNRELPNTNITVPNEVYKKDNYIFANGIPIIVKKDNNDGRTYVYDAAGTTKLLATEVNGMEIYGGSYQGVVASTNVTLESGTIARIYGGGYKGCVTGLAKISVTGGDITEVIYGGSYDGDVGGTEIYTSGPYVAKGVNAGSRNGTVLGNTKVLLENSVAKGLYAGTGGDGRGVGFPSSDVTGNATYTIVGGMFESLYGGCKSGVIRGTSTITLVGQVIAKTAINPISNGGVLGGTTVKVPANYIYMDKITSGGNFTIETMGDAPIAPTPEVTIQKEEVLSASGDAGKLVYRFISIPEPNGKLTGRPGESYFITFPNGENMLVDAGGDSDWSEGIITSFLESMHVTKIDYVVASHYHADHIGRMASIFNAKDANGNNKYEIGKLYTTGYAVPLTGGYYTTLRDWMTTNPTKTINIWQGDKFNIGGVDIEVLGPVNDPYIIQRMTGIDIAGNAITLGDTDYNNNSIVMKMTYGENTALLTGDLYIDAEARLVATYGADKLKVDMLKVPHHGDTTSSDPEFVAAVSPKIAVINHISDTTIVSNRYKGAGADTYVTGVDGIIKVAFDGINEGVVTAEKYVAEHASIDVTGGSEIMYVDSTTQTTASYTYSVNDQYGKAIAIDSAQVIRTLTDDNGIPVNDSAITFENDTLTVTGKPQVAYVVVKYTYGELKASKRVTFTSVPLSDYTVTIDGPEELSLTAAEGGTATYTTVVKNNNGEEVTGIPVELSLTKYTGLNASLTDNKLVVTGNSTSGVLTLNAVFAGTTEVVKTKSVKVTAAPAVPVVNGNGSETVTDTKPVITTDEKPVITTNPDGTTKAITTVAKESVVAALKDAAKTTFEVNVKSNATESIAKLNADSFTTLADKKVDLVVKTSTVELNIPSSVVDAAAIAKKLGTTADKIDVEVKVVEVPQSQIVLPEGTTLKPTDKVYSFTITASNGTDSIKIDSFGTNEVIGTIPMPAEFVGKDEARINVYKYNELTKTLELRPTKIVDGKIIFKTSSFSLYTVMLNTVSFDDVKTHWADKYVHTLAAKSIINGKGENVFDPEGKMTRAEFASIIARAFNLPEGTNEAFTDVQGDAWYAKNINAAYAAGLIEGNGDRSFMPDAFISREEMAVIAARAYKYAKGTEASSKLEAKFTDANEISDWAAEDIATVFRLGLVKGSNDMFAPKSDMTRAEGATIIYNLLVKLGLL